MFLDFKSDESYTPNKISIRAGSQLQDMKEVLVAEMKEPMGWYTFHLKTKYVNGNEKYLFCIPLGPSWPP